MDKLEQYIEQVCKSIGGPWDLRQHVRQELREHLLDAVAQHKAAGMTEAEAVSKALEEFGKPEEVRSELEAAYGQRTMWIVDKAMQWKEMTMRAKWLWTTWAYLALAAVIALEVSFLWFMGVFIIPKFNLLLRVGMIDSEMLQEQAGSAWMPGFLNDMNAVGGGYALWWILLAIVLIGLFEWRVKSENKPFMRVSALGTVAVGLMVLVTLTAAALVIPFCLAMPAFGGMARPWAAEQVAGIDKSVNKLEQAVAAKDWAAAQDHASQARSSVLRLHSAPTTAWADFNELEKAETIRSYLSAAAGYLAETQNAIRNHNPARAGAMEGDPVQAALRDFRKEFDPVRAAAKRPAR